MSLAPRLFTHEYDVARVAPDNDATAWLSAAEHEEYGNLRDARRCNEWLAGRLLLKRAVRRALANDDCRTPTVRLHDIEVFSRDAFGRGQSPRAFISGRTLPWHLSLAHAGGVAWAALSTDARVRVGIDVVSEASQLIAHELFFSDEELHWMDESTAAPSAATLWAVKEAVYKATNRGEPFMPAQIVVRPDGAGGMTCRGNRLSRHACSITVNRSGKSIIATAVVSTAWGTP